MKPHRRELRFETLDAVVRDAENLMSSEYVQVGKWDLSQICQHLASWMKFPIEGFPRSPFFIRAMMWMMRTTIGPKKLRQIVEQRSMAADIPTMPETVFKPHEDAAAAIATLKLAVTKFKEYAGPIHPSPFFGAMSKEEATQLQLIHCSHHLSFLIPKS